MGALSGMKEICDNLRRSEATVLDLIRHEGFPAVKIKGIWESDTQKIENWRLGKIDQAATGKPSDNPLSQKGQKKRRQVRPKGCQP